MNSDAMAPLGFPSTDGDQVALSDPTIGDFVLFIYPRLSRPDQPDADEWALIPGAKGCTAESCEFRDLAADFAQIGFSIFGLSTQDTDAQRDAVARLHLPYPLLSDPRLTLARALDLPTFVYGGDELYTRSTLVVRGGAIVHTERDITDAAAHPSELLAHLAGHVL